MNKRDHKNAFKFNMLSHLNFKGNSVKIFYFLSITVSHKNRFGFSMRSHLKGM